VSEAPKCLPVRLSRRSRLSAVFPPSALSPSPSPPRLSLARSAPNPRRPKRKVAECRGTREEGRNTCSSRIHSYLPIRLATLLRVLRLYVPSTEDSLLISTSNQSIRHYHHHHHHHHHSYCPSYVNLSVSHLSSQFSVPTEEFRPS
jgi:hypothetical protein